MRHFVVEITYTAPLTAIDAVLPAHRAFLQQGYETGQLLMSGPMTPRMGGIVIARAESIEAVQAFFRDDPYQQQGLADYRYVEFTPVKHQAIVAAWCGEA
jgi:uncharacterized protein YciI